MNGLESVSGLVKSCCSVSWGRTCSCQRFFLFSPPVGECNTNKHWVVLSCCTSDGLVYCFSEPNLMRTLLPDCRTGKSRALCLRLKYKACRSFHAASLCLMSDRSGHLSLTLRSKLWCCVNFPAHQKFCRTDVVSVAQKLKGASRGSSCCRILFAVCKARLACPFPDGWCRLDVICEVILLTNSFKGFTSNLWPIVWRRLCWGSCIW